MKNIQKKVLYESIMKSVAKTIKQALNEAELEKDSTVDYYLNVNPYDISKEEAIEAIRAIVDEYGDQQYLDGNGGNINPYMNYWYSIEYNGYRVGNHRHVDDSFELFRYEEEDDEDIIFDLLASLQDIILDSDN